LKTIGTSSAQASEYFEVAIESEPGVLRSVRSEELGAIEVEADWRKPLRPNQLERLAAEARADIQWGERGGTPRITITRHFPDEPAYTYTLVFSEKDGKAGFTQVDDSSP
jgi:hypothetical protein